MLCYNHLLRSFSPPHKEIFLGCAANTRNGSKHTDRRQAIQFPTAGLIFINNSIAPFPSCAVLSWPEFPCSTIQALHHPQTLETMKADSLCSAFNASFGRKRRNEIFFFALFSPFQASVASHSGRKRQNMKNWVDNNFQVS